MRQALKVTHLILVLVLLTTTAALQGQTPGPVTPWSHADVGTPVPGDAVAAGDGSFEITGAGNDIWNNGDNFHYMFIEMSGDGAMTARVVDNGTGSNAWAKGGVMMRQTLESGSVNVYVAITGGNGQGATFQRRNDPDAGSGSSRTKPAPVAPPYWVKLVREGDTFTGYLSEDGENWYQEGADSQTIVMTDPIYVGLAVTSHAAGELRTFTFDSVSGEGGAQLADPGQASAPAPAHEAVDVDRNIDLAWAAGETAVKRNLYFGTVFDDVNDATLANPLGVLAEQNLTATGLDVGTLAYDQTYYWRVDEVNGAPDNTVFKGEVWSFTVEPFSYPIADVTATASSQQDPDMGPEKTVGGIGLDDMDQHSTLATDMWLSGVGDPAPAIQYAFDKAYKLDKLWVWNSNQMVESFVGLGAKDVVVEYSVDGTEWTVLEGATLLNQATGNASYTANTSIEFGGVQARYVKITIAGGYGFLPQYGISEVRFYFIPTFAREPQPADSALVDGASVQLAWRAGREAVGHEVHLGTDAADLPLVATTTEATYAAQDLDYDTTYYWSIVEVNENEAVSTYAGPVWRFTTPPYGTIDNFDQYNDNCKRIFFSWEDGLGHSGGDEIDDCDVPASNGNGGGSIVGNDQAPFAEQTIVYAGSQSLPFSYDNAFGDSYATLTLDGQDWTASGVQSLSLMFYGAADNTGQLYVKINNTKVGYDGPADDIQASQWRAWIIDLTALSGLQNVTSLTIGVDGANAAGMLYIDEIRLYPLPGELVVPTEPSADGLVAYLSFDEGSGTSAADSSGNNNDGDVVGDAQWVTGKVGGALAFDGVDDMVIVTQNSGLPIYNNGTDDAYAVAMWVKGGPQNDMRVFSEGSTTDNNPLLNLGTHNSATPTGQFAAYIRPDTGTTLNHPLSQAEPFDDTWHHIAWVDENGTARLYVDGHLDGGDFNYTRGTMALDTTTVGGILRAAPSHWFTGEIDEVRIYNRALSQAEVAWLAGKTTPFAKPF